MLPSNYDSLAAKHPELAPVLGRIGAWVRAHADWNLIDPRVLSKDLRDLDVITLARGLQVLVDERVLREVYMVATPDTGVLAEGEFEELDDIPERLSDRWNHSFNTADADIVAVLTK